MGLNEIKSKLKEFPPIGKAYDFLIGNRKVQRVKQERRNALQENGTDVILMTKETLDELGLEWFADYGTLLGIVRDNCFIPHDEDMDFGLYFNDHSRWNAIEEAFEKKGAMKLRQIELNGVVEEMTFQWKGVPFDLFRHWKEDGKDRAYYFKIFPDVKYPNSTTYTPCILTSYGFDEIIPYSFKGIEVNIPKQYDEYLTGVYTRGWKSPDPTWSGSDEVDLQVFKDQFANIL